MGFSNIIRGMNVDGSQKSVSFVKTARIVRTHEFYMLKSDSICLK